MVQTARLGDYVEKAFAFSDFIFFTRVGRPRGTVWPLSGLSPTQKPAVLRTLPLPAARTTEAVISAERNMASDRFGFLLGFSPAGGEIELCGALADMGLVLFFRVFYRSLLYGKIREIYGYCHFVYCMRNVRLPLLYGGGQVHV